MNQSQWNPLTIQPPDEMVEVLDENGMRARALPTYYAFHLEGSKVILCEPYWDGGWLVECQDVVFEIGTIIGWRRIPGD